MAIIQRYLDVLLADLSYASWNEAMAVAYVQFDRAGNRAELGQVSELQVAELEREFLQVLRKRVASEAGQRLTRSLLAQAIGHPRDLPRDLIDVSTPSALPAPGELDVVIDAAEKGHRWLAEQRERVGDGGRQMLDMGLRQQALELIMRLQVLETVARFAAADMVYRDLSFEQSRVLYEQEKKADLGFSMSQQTLAGLLEVRTGYCRLLALAELRALRGESKARLLERRAKVATAKLGTQSAERELARAEELFDRGLIASEELKDAELGMAAANAAEQAAQAAEVVAAVLHEYTELRAIRRHRGGAQFLARGGDLQHATS